MAFCSKCGSELSAPDADVCTHCGRLVKEQFKTVTHNEIKIKRSDWWVLLPVFFGIIGGIIAYFAIRYDKPKLANQYMALGIIMSVIHIIFIFGSMMLAHTP